MFNYIIKIVSNRNVEKISFILTQKNGVCEKLGSQINLCAYVMYEWYLEGL